jgi:hypothetical protein
VRGGPLVVEQVEQRGGDVGPVGGQHTDGGRARGLHVGRPRQLAQLGERAQPSLADDPPGGLGARAEDPARVAGADRAEGVGEVALLGPAVALQQHQLVLLEDHAAGQHLVEGRPQRGPHLRPHRRELGTEGVRVPRAEERCVRIVVEQSPARSPRDVHRQLRAQHQLDGVAQGDGPAVRRSERGVGPRDVAHPPRHLAVPDERRLHDRPPGCATGPGCPARAARCNSVSLGRGAGRDRSGTTRTAAGS